jgi:hypothetical protein
MGGLRVATFLVAGAACALAGCAQLLNYNTLNLSATVDQLTI